METKYPYDGDEDDTVFSEEQAGDEQAAKHHREPVGMETAVALRIAVHLHPILKNAVLLPIFLLPLRVIVRINKIVARVVRRVNVNALHLFAVSGR